MSKVEAYICDYCNHIKPADEVVGIKRIQDMFDKLKSFPINPHPEKESIHYCLTCYDTHVVRPTNRETNRKKDEAGYTLKLLEMSYNLASQCVANFDKKMFAKSCKSKK